MSPSPDDRADLEPGDAIRTRVEELGKLHPDYPRAQVYATLGLREAALELVHQPARGGKDEPADPELRCTRTSAPVAR